MKAFSCLVIIQFVSICFSSRTCASLFDNSNFEWMWMSSGEDATMESGTAEFYSNRTMVTWNPAGEVINSGTFSITQNKSWCYALEKYDFPEDKVVCKTFVIEQVTDTIIGCLKLDSCYESCNSDDAWQTWSAARLRFRF